PKKKKKKPFLFPLTRGFFWLEYSKKISSPPCKVKKSIRTNKSTRFHSRQHQPNTHTVQQSGQTHTPVNYSPTKFTNPILILCSGVDGYRVNGITYERQCDI